MHENMTTNLLEVLVAQVHSDQAWFSDVILAKSPPARGQVPCIFDQQLIVEK